MDPTVATAATRSVYSRTDQDDPGLDSLQFNDEIRSLISFPQQESGGGGGGGGSSFTALLELPATQVVELLQDATDPGDSPAIDAGGVSGGEDLKPRLEAAFDRTTTTLVTFPPNAGLVERAARFSVFSEERSGNVSPEEMSNSGGNVEKVKSEPADTDSSQPLVSDPTAEESKRPMKRKEREKKAKSSAKKSKGSAEDAEKLPYVHVRARRGQATDSHSLAERARREKINARMKLLQELVPGCNKISGTALVLDEIINHVQFLQRQVEFLSMKLATVDPRIDSNLESILAAESGSLMDSNMSGMAMPMMWPEVQINGNRQDFEQQWHFDTFHQPVWGREQDTHNFITPENSLLSYDSSTNSATLHPNQVKMEL